MGWLPTTVRLVQCDQVDAMAATPLLIERIAVEGRVADHTSRLDLGEAMTEGGIDQFRFMRRSAGDAAGEGNTMAVCDRHDFTAFSSASRADNSAPFFAELKLASVNVSGRSGLPRVFRPSACTCNNRVRMPSRSHR